MIHLFRNKTFEISLIIILFVALLLRLYKYDAPIADWHSWRQADTASVTRIYIQERLDLFKPRYHDLSNIPSGQDNPQGWRMVEFPIFNLWHYLIYQLSYNNLTIEQSGRIAAALVSTIGIGFWGLVIKRLSNPIVALISSLAWTVMPYAIFFNRVILPDPMMVTLAIISSYLALLSFEKTSKFPLWFIMSAIFATLAILTKPTAIFYLSAQGIGILYLQYKRPQKYFFRLLIVYALIVFSPIYWWREVWIKQFPSGIPDNKWLLNQDNIRGSKAWIRWLFYERIGLLMMGAWNSIFFITGLLSRKKNQEYWIIILGISMFMYLYIFAMGNVRHDYYQIPLIPFISWGIGIGIYNIWTNRHNYLFGSIIVFLIVFVGSNLFAWYQIRGLYQINNSSIIKAGIHANELLPSTALVIAPYMGDTAFLYQINRKGWPSITNYPIEEMINKGATHYVSVNYDQDTKDIMTKYKTIYSNEEYIIIDLRNSI